MYLKIAQFISIMLIALVMGVFWGTWFTLGQSITFFAPETFLAIGQAIIRNVAPIMPILTTLAIVSTLPILFLLPQKRSMPFYLTALGFLLILAATLITVLIEVPIDNQIKVWTPSSLPSDWQAIRDRWEFYHTVRSFVSIGSLASIVAGALLPPLHAPANDQRPR